MGTINLASGNIITLGYDEDYYTSDEELREWAIEQFETNAGLQEWYTLEGYIKLRAEEDYAEMIHDTVSDIYEWVKRDIDDTKLISGIINICIEPGYYSGAELRRQIKAIPCYSRYRKVV
jgi:hypothetical protein